MKKLIRHLIAGVFGIGITVGLVFFMIALISLDNDNEPHPNKNYLTTQVKVSSPPGFKPSKEVDSISKKKHRQLPSKRKIQLPIDHKKLVSHIRAQEPDGTKTDQFAAPSQQQRLLKLGSKSQAKVVLAGQFNVIGPDPQYPYEALLAGQEGWVEAMIHLKNDGTVDEIDIIGAGPAGIFEMAVVTAVFDWKVQFEKADESQIQSEYYHRFEFKISE